MSTVEDWTTAVTATPAAEPLVVDDQDRQTFRVHRSAMTSPEVHRAEMERVFGHSWLYVGHESEIPKPGDFVRRKLAGRPIFMVRGAKSGDVNVFHNSCTHRGALVCRQDSGNSKVFQCFYHAWSFDSEGNLKGVPDREGYSKGLNFEQLGLARVARVESYRGFVFASSSANTDETAAATIPRGARKARNNRSLCEILAVHVEAQTESGRMTKINTNKNPTIGQPSSTTSRKSTREPNTMNKQAISSTCRFSLNSITCFSVTVRWLASGSRPRVSLTS